MPSWFANDGVESEAPQWEPEPFELPLIEPTGWPSWPPARDDQEREHTGRVVIIDLV